MTRPLLIKGGRVIDPASETDGISDLLVKDGLIAAISENIECDEAIVSNAEGLWVVPGFIDLRSHLREPGEEYKEDFSSGGKAWPLRPSRLWSPRWRRLCVRRPTY